MVSPSVRSFQISVVVHGSFRKISIFKQAKQEPIRLLGVAPETGRSSHGGRRFTYHLLETDAAGSPSGLRSEFELE
jgi:hypothetical protein